VHGVALVDLSDFLNQLVHETLLIRISRKISHASVREVAFGRRNDDMQEKKKKIMSGKM